VLRRGDGGAGTLLLLLVAGGVIAAASGIEVAWGFVNGQGEARIAADAAAHAAEVSLVHSPDADRLSDALQTRQATCVYPFPAGAVGAPDPGAAPGDACQAAFAAAVAAAAANGGRVVDFVVSPDPRYLDPGAGAGPLEVTVHVRVPRPLPLVSRFCAAAGESPCWAEAWSAAQEHGRP